MRITLLSSSLIASLILSACSDDPSDKDAPTDETEETDSTDSTDSTDDTEDPQDTDEPPAVDADNDGYPSDVDCNDNDETIHPDADDYCGDSIDSNCDEKDGLATLYTGVEYASGSFTYTDRELLTPDVLESYTLPEGTVQPRIEICDDLTASFNIQSTDELIIFGYDNPTISVPEGESAIVVGPNSSVTVKNLDYDSPNCNCDLFNNGNLFFMENSDITNPTALSVFSTSGQGNITTLTDVEVSGFEPAGTGTTQAPVRNDVFAQTTLTDCRFSEGSNPNGTVGARVTSGQLTLNNTIFTQNSGDHVFYLESESVIFDCDGGPGFDSGAYANSANSFRLNGRQSNQPPGDWDVRLTQCDFGEGSLTNGSHELVWTLSGETTAHYLGNNVTRQGF